MRYIAPAAAAVILFTCVISLFRNRPRAHKLAKLINQNDGAIVDIEHWETSIGRSRSNDIVLRFPGVSRFHAVITKRRRDWILTNTTEPQEDLLAKVIPQKLYSLLVKTTQSEPIFVNGERMEARRVLENGDTITIGQVPLKFVCDEAVSDESRKQIRSAAQAQASKTVAYAVLVDIKTRRPVYLKKEDVLIGRGSGCDIQIMSQAVSASHARIYKTSRGWALADLDSHNGTKLNGRYINQPQLIFDEDMLTFGDKVFIFYEK